MLYYGAGVSYGVMGSLAGTDAELDNHPFQKNSVPDRLVRYADRPATCADCPAIVRRYIQTVRRSGRSEWVI
jgi:hypothetical protein